MRGDEAEGITTFMQTPEVTSFIDMHSHSVILHLYFACAVDFLHSFSQLRLAGYSIIYSIFVTSQ